LNTHAVGKPLVDASRSLEVIARTTPGMSGADLANLLNEAAIACALHNEPHITQADLEAARDKVRYGKERKSLVLNPKERELVAYHEAGHTIIHLQTSLLAPLYKVSIVPRGQALGATVLLPDEDQILQSKAMLVEQLLVLMGGRAAERTFFGSTTNGASGDLDMARKIARKNGAWAKSSTTRRSGRTLKQKSTGCSKSRTKRRRRLSRCKRRTPKGWPKHYWNKKP
jgi:cell division protease FtsH